ncbi:hypothetical protein PSEUDO8Z_120107 [Pseudomonas sp. 8Z]|uniref:hypothetical protein n=1 Tax=Pseudomonas sp. 8Z TaxID=2653166 RepID=UPI0012EEE70A|nr:hypothetical protein [Pseudomonas sp. 8Z]VXC52144.1 hypothetical protein PSEUDO8Z_120107 [Pseudomonas sp. 8Z]
MPHASCQALPHAQAPYAGIASFSLIIENISISVLNTAAICCDETAQRKDFSLPVQQPRNIDEDCIIVGHILSI